MNTNLARSSLTLIAILILNTLSLIGCSNETDELTNNYHKIVEASNEFSKVKNGKFVYHQEKPPFIRTVEFVRRGDDIDWLKADPDMKYSKYVGGKAYILEGEQWVEIEKEYVVWPSEFSQFTAMIQGDSKNVSKDILSIKVKKKSDIIEYEVQYDVKRLGKLNYDKAYKSYIKENPGLSEAEISEFWDNISASDYEPDSMITIFGVDENNVLVYIDSLMSKDEGTFKQKTELTEYNIELTLE